MKKTIFTLLFVASVQLIQAQEDTYKKNVLKFLEMSGQSANIKLSIIDISKNVPNEKKDAFLAEMNTSIKELMSKIADSYMAEFSEAEILEIIKFYETPVGRRLTIKNMPLAQKGQKIGQEWGQGLQATMAKYLQN